MGSVFRGLTVETDFREARFWTTSETLDNFANDIALYHSLLGLAGPKQVLGHLSEMPTIRPRDENAFSGYFVCPASPVPHLHIAVCARAHC
jgi:hypothetical protein